MVESIAIVSMSGLQIRDARAGDRDAAEGVTLAAFQEYAASKSNRWENYRQNILAALAAVRPATQIVAEQNSEIIGSVLLYPRGTVITIPGGAITLRWPEARLLAVAPAARGQGVGAALMQECVQRARQSGERALALHTADVRNAAMRLYERMGFHRAPELDFEPAPGFTAKGYLLTLEAPDS